jgi:hypothetical protein
MVREMISAFRLNHAVGASLPNPPAIVCRRARRARSAADHSQYPRLARIVTNIVTTCLTIVPDNVTALASDGTRTSTRGDGRFGRAFKREVGCLRCHHDHRAIFENTRFKEIPMGYVGRHFTLSNRRDHGVFCDENGLSVGGVPCWNELAVTAAPSNGARARYSVSNRDLSKRYGLPIDISPKMGSLAAMARALDRGDLVHASIAALHLQLPDPPELAKSPPAVPEVIELARNLKASGLLKADWDPTKHPRWPAGSPGGIGGEFSASGSANLDSPIVEPNPKLLPVQLTIPAPFEIPGIPLPSEVLPAPFLPPNVSPLHIPRNPYPGRRRCVKEWTEAIDYCLGLWTKGWLARGDYRGSGRTISECIMGRVSQDCGGNRLDS